MKRSILVGAAFVAGLVLLTIVDQALKREVPPAAATPPVTPSATPAPETKPEAEPQAAPEARPGFLYGRITTVDGTNYEGRLRCGGDQEAFWGDYFNGDKAESLWVPLVPPERLPKENDSIEIFGIDIVHRERPIEVGRRFMARFGDITRIEAGGHDVRVTLKSGTTFSVNRFGASDFDDGMRVWDDKRGTVDLDDRRIRAIDLLPTPRLAGTPSRLHGTVRTRQGEFTGFIQWDREECVGTDELDGHTAEGDRSLRFDSIRSIESRSRESLVTLLDGSKIVLSGTNDVGRGNRGLYVDDRRYGRVLISWDAFERIDFSPSDSGPAYGDFPPGLKLTGSVTTRAGTRLAGKLVYDLDESETTETLDAPSRGVDYTIPFGLVASIVRPARDEPGAQPTKLTLQNGEELRLESRSDLGEGNAGMLIFVEGQERPEYVLWADVAQIDFDRPPATGNSR